MAVENKNESRTTETPSYFPIRKKTGPKGGKRKNAGGPPKVYEKTKLKREIAAEAAARGILPLEVMLEQMRFYHAESEGVLGELKEIVKTKDLKKIDPVLSKLMTLKREALDRAALAAPFIHPRLSATHITGHSVQVRLTDSSLPTEARQQMFMDLVRTTKSGKPLLLDLKPTEDGDVVVVGNPDA